MASPPEVGVAARTSVIYAFVVIAGIRVRAAAAEPTDAEIIGGARGWHIESVELRTSYLDQAGRGFQSQDNANGGPGGEAMYVIQPSALITIRQSERVVHQIALPVDAITAASPDAVDATTSASRRNTAGDLDWRTTIKLSDVTAITTRAVAHVEEWLVGGTLGAGWRRSLAEDNATISVNGSFGADVFDDHDHFGEPHGNTTRETTNINLSGSQLLSPTTVIDASYGLTYQHGSLRTGWNAVPFAGGTMLTDENVPSDRLRHALSVRISQHIPRTRSTVKARYRGYVDDFGVRAHTVDAAAYQYLAGWLYVRGAYRFHHQRGATFFTTDLPLGFDDNTLRTADSDLATLNAHEVSFQIATIRDRGPLHRWSISAEVFRYQRSNDLQITAVSFGIGRGL